MKKETFNIVGTNAAAIAAGGAGYIVVEDFVEAQKNNNVPHNAFTIGNQSTSCTLFIFLDQKLDTTKPDYILFPSQQITLSHEEGVTFTHLYVLNTHAATEVAIAELKYRISTVKEVE
jgi:hypothetical protein